MEETNTMRKEIKRRIHEVENELRALKELVDSEAFAPKEPALTEFEEMLYSIFDAYNGLKIDVRAAVDANAKTLLELAKKEICMGCTVGLDQYWKGREDARKEYDKSYTFHYNPPCYHGGVCTNPMRDCINCPRTGGDIGTFTTSGTCKKD
jgi:hypothetical protein